MKKIAIAAIMMISFAGIGFAQTSPKKAKAEKVEAKKDGSKTSDTSAHHHMHKGTKHAKAKA